MIRNRVTERKSRNAVSKVLVLNLDPFLICNSACCWVEVSNVVIVKKIVSLPYATFKFHYPFNGFNEIG